jgi:hypothetical protein
MEELTLSRPPLRFISFLLLSLSLVWQTPNLLSVFFFFFLFAYCCYLSERYILHITNVFLFFSFSLNLLLFYFEEKEKENNHHDNICLLCLKKKFFFFQATICFFFFHGSFSMNTKWIRISFADWRHHPISFRYFIRLMSRNSTILLTKL